MNPKSEGSERSRPVAEAAEPVVEETVHEQVPEHAVDPMRKNADLPKGVDKADGVLESVNDDLKRVEKRTTS